LCREEFKPPPIPIQVVHQEGRASARVRALVDVLAEGLRTDPELRGELGEDR
jgi:hypothetical protein